MKFIAVNNNTMFDPLNEQKQTDICREIIAVDSIRHIYVMLPDEANLCIEWLDRKGNDRDIIESFSARGECLHRFKELSKMLCDERRADR